MCLCNSVHSGHMTSILLSMLERSKVRDVVCVQIVKTLWGKLICDIGLYKMNWIEIHERMSVWCNDYSEFLLLLFSSSQSATARLPGSGPEGRGAAAEIRRRQRDPRRRSGPESRRDRILLHRSPGSVPRPGGVGSKLLSEGVRGFCRWTWPHCRPLTCYFAPGMEVASYLSDKAASVAVVGTSGCPYERSLGPEIGRMSMQVRSGDGFSLNVTSSNGTKFKTQFLSVFFVKMLEEQSVKFYMNDAVAEIQGENGKVTLTPLALKGFHWTEHTCK